MIEILHYKPDRGNNPDKIAPCDPQIDTFSKPYNIQKESMPEISNNEYINQNSSQLRYKITI